MNFRSADALLVHENMTLKDALAAMNDGREGILFLVDSQGRFLRTITDGDLRRLWLGQEDMGRTLAGLPEVKSATILHDAYTPAAALTCMDEKAVNTLPLLDAEGRPVGLVHRRDIPGTVYLSSPHLGDQELEFVNEAFRTNWIAPLGPNVDGFEREICAYTGSAHAAALSSGTAALHVALCLLGVGRGDSVFCSDLTFVASANPILYQGARPVFIDADPATWNLCPLALERALEAAAKDGQLPKAVIVVHLYGQSADLDPIIALCEQYGVTMIEDAAESLGATYKKQHTGTLGRLGIFSFNGNKIITTSGGGMLVSDDGALIERARHLATQARDPAPWYEHSEVGFNYRMSNILAGVGRGQLQVLDERVAARRAVYQRYREWLGDIDAIEWHEEASFGRSNRWLTAIALRSGHAVRPKDVISALQDQHIEARHVWKPMHLQPLFADAPFHARSEDGDVAADLFARGLCLPSGSNLDEADQARTCEIIRGLLQTA